MLVRIFDLTMHNAGGLSRLYVCVFLESFYVESVLMKIKDNIAMHFAFLVKNLKKKKKKK